MAQSAYEESTLDLLKNNWKIVTSIVVMLGIVILGFIGLQRWISGDTPSLDSQPQLVRDTNFKTGNSADTGIQLVYAFDYQCSACASNDEAIEQLRENYSSQIQFVYKNFPIKSSHPQAEIAAYGGEAVAKVAPEKFNTYKSTIMQRQNQLGGGSETLREIVRELGIDVNDWEDAYNSSSIRTEVDQDLSDIENIRLPSSQYESPESNQITSTPTTIILKDGEVVTWWAGALPYQTQAERLDAVLGTSSSSTVSAQDMPLNSTASQDPATLESSAMVSESNSL